MREEDIDQLIASWDERLRRVDENLIALEGEPTYQMLAGGARASLVGQTKVRVVPALDALAELFDHRERLSAVVGRAKEIRGSLGFWNKDEKLAEVAALLGGPSISLGTRQMPVAQRNLLDPTTTEVAVVPEQLLFEMVRTYQLARDAVALVSDAWAQLEPRILSLEAEVARVRTDAASIGSDEATHDDLAQIEAELGRVRTLVAADPLAVVGSMESALAPRLASVRARVSTVVGYKTNATRRLGEASAVLARVDASEKEAEAASQRAAEEIAGFDVDAGAHRARREVAQGLGPWRDKIAEAARLGHWKAADVGITRWHEAAEGVIASHRSDVAAANAALETRIELRGRLGARRAQANAMAARGAALPAEVDGLARDAEATLGARPTDIGRATRELDRFEAAVRALGTRR